MTHPQQDSNNTTTSSSVTLNGPATWVLLVMLAVLIATCLYLASAARDSAVAAAVASERADKAERSAAINREYAVQVFPQLNRMGYPVRTPGEVDHYTAQPEDYAHLDAFHEQQEHKP